MGGREKGRVGGREGRMKKQKKGRSRVGGGWEGNGGKEGGKEEDGEGGRKGELIEIKDDTNR